MGKLFYGWWPRSPEEGILNELLHCHEILWFNGVAIFRAPVNQRFREHEGREVGVTWGTCWLGNQSMMVKMQV